MIPGPAPSVGSLTKSNGQNRAHDAPNDGDQVRTAKFQEILRRLRREWCTDSISRRFEHRGHHHLGILLRAVAALVHARAVLAVGG